MDNLLIFTWDATDRLPTKRLLLQIGSAIFQSSVFVTFDPESIALPKMRVNKS